VLAWAPEHSGYFTVRSCYRLLKKENDQRDATAMNEAGTSGPNPWWKKIWKLRVPPKIHIFWWRAVNNFLPSKGEFKQRHVSQEDHC
jgi:hypothetical protein